MLKVHRLEKSALLPVVAVVTIMIHDMSYAEKVPNIVYLAQLEWLALAGGVEMELGERGSVKSHFDSCPTPGMGGKSSLN